MENNSFELEKTIESLMYKRGPELEIAIENLRKDSLFNQAAVLRQKLVNDGRCPVCTLKIPCKHYASHEDVKVHKDIINISSPAIQVNTPNSQKSVHISITPDISSFKVRYRGKRTESPKPKRKSDEFEKLKLMEKLEKYKEEKLQREIQHIEEIKRIEEMEKERAKEMEKKREAYYKKQKEKLKWYKEDLKQRIEAMEKKKNSFEMQERVIIQQQKKAHESSPKIENLNTPKNIKRKYKFKSSKDMKHSRLNL